MQPIIEIRQLSIQDCIRCRFSANKEELWNQTYTNAQECIEKGDYTTAFDLYNSLAEDGCPPAKFALAHFYINGLVSAKDYARAILLLTEASHANYGPACLALGRIYARGSLGYPKNDSLAFDLYARAAEKDMPEAHTNLGLMFVKGRGCQKNHRRAFECFVRATKKGYPMGCYNLGLMYARGWAVDQSYRKAFQHYIVAARAGVSYAQNNLANLLREGLGCKKSIPMAKVWYKKAAEQGIQEAQTALDVLSNG